MEAKGEKLEIAKNLPQVISVIKANNNVTPPIQKYLNLPMKRDGGVFKVIR